MIEAGKSRDTEEEFWRIAGDIGALEEVLRSVMKHVRFEMACFLC